jgi:hypothetical protein
MAKERTSVRMQAQIKTLSEQGYSIRSIARILKLSRKTVRKFLANPATETREVASWVSGVNWEYVRQEVYGKGTTIKQLHLEVGTRGSIFKLLASVSGSGSAAGLRSTSHHPSQSQAGREDPDRLL